ncbi:hypothetical protein FOCC_FOCC009180 [Frankliniella occidentalis]|nr:hypothetical protein FOCC_FOCC009180 [Frankliniella occidentalis]
MTENRHSTTTDRTTTNSISRKSIRLDNKTEDNNSYTKLKVLHQNVRFIANKKNMIDTILNELCPDVMVASETALHAGEPEASKYIGYVNGSSYCRSKGVGRGGGVIILVKECYRNLTQEVDVSEYIVDNIFEVCAVKIKFKWDHRTYYIFGIYRPPPLNNVNTFFKNLSSLLLNFTNSENVIMVAGDFNLDLLVKNKHAKEFIDIMECYGIRPCFDSVTRKHYTTETCIDNICMSGDFPLCAEVIETYISDHYAQLLTLYVQTGNLKEDTYNVKRTCNDQNIQHLTILLEKENWQEVLTATCAEEAIVNFLDTFNYYFNLTCPIKKSKVRSHTSKKSTELPNDILYIKNLIDLVNEKQSNGQPSATLKELNNNLKKKYHYLLKQSNINRNMTYIETSEKRSKATWKIVNEHRNVKAKDKDVITLKTGDDNVTKPEDVAITFNSYYINLPKNIIKDKQESDFKILSEKNLNTMFLQPITIDELTKAISTLKNKTSSGLDEISNIIIKKIAPWIIS